MIQSPHSHNLTRWLEKERVDWKEFFEASKVGLKNFFVEMDMPVLKESAAYLKKLG